MKPVKPTRTKKGQNQKHEYSSPLITEEKVESRMNVLRRFTEKFVDGTEDKNLSLFILPLKMFLLRTPDIFSERDVGDFMDSLTPDTKTAFRRVYTPFSLWLGKTTKSQMPDLLPPERGRKRVGDRAIDWAPDSVMMAIGLLARRIPPTHLAAASLGDWIDAPRLGGWRLLRRDRVHLTVDPKTVKSPTHVALRRDKIEALDFYTEIEARDVILVWGWEGKAMTVDQNLPFIPIHAGSRVSVSARMLVYTLDSCRFTVSGSQLPYRSR